MRDVMASTRFWLAAEPLRKIAEKKVNWPHFCLTKLSEVGSVRPEHQSGDSTRKVASRFWREVVDLFLRFEKGFSRKKLIENMDVDRFA